MCIPISVILCPLVLKILSGTEILTSIKGCNSIANLSKMMLYNINIDFITVTAQEIPRGQDTEEFQ